MCQMARGALRALRLPVRYFGGCHIVHDGVSAGGRLGGGEGSVKVRVVESRSGEVHGRVRLD